MSLLVTNADSSHFAHVTLLLSPSVDDAKAAGNEEAQLDEEKIKSMIDEDESLKPTKQGTSSFLSCNVYELSFFFPI